MLRQGLLYVISAPSGAGKTTLCNAIIDLFPELGQSISFSTREMRAGEVDGVDYHFVDVATFRHMIGAGEFVEWAEVHGNFYGTAIHTLNEAQGRGQDILLDIDFQGASQLKELGLNAVFIFIAPPSFAELEKRLHQRGTDSADVVDCRIKNAHSEMAQARWYDYIIVNDNLDKALTDLQAVLRAERCRAKLILPWLKQHFQV